MLFRKLRHRLKARNRHGVHSPLVYRLVDTVLLRPDGRPVRERIREHFTGWHWQELPATQLSEAGTRLQPLPAVVFVPAPHQNEAGWAAAATHPTVSVAVDCWEFGLLLATPDVKEPQYFRLRYDP